MPLKNAAPVSTCKFDKITVYFYYLVDKPVKLNYSFCESEYEEKKWDF